MGDPPPTCSRPSLLAGQTVGLLGQTAGLSGPTAALIGQTTGLRGQTLGLDVGTTRPVPHRCWTAGSVRWMRTVNLFFIYISLGLVSSTYSATLLELQWMTSVTIDTAAILITLFNLGRLIGSLFASRLFNRSGAELWLTASLACGAIFFALVPWCPTYATMAFTVVVQGVLFSNITVGATVHCFTLWRRTAGPFIQGLHFFFSCGSALAPLLANPFLCAANLLLLANQRSDINGTSPTMYKSNITEIFSSGKLSTNEALENGLGFDQLPEGLVPIEVDYDEHRTGFQNFTESLDFEKSQDLAGQLNFLSRELFTSPWNSSLHSNINNSLSNDSLFADDDVPCSNELFRWPYTIVSTAQLLISASILVSLFITGIPSRRSPFHLKPLFPGKLLKTNTTDTPRSLRRPLAVLFSAIYFCHANVEATSAALILPFAVSHLGMSKAAGNYVALVFWAAVACGRGSGILISKFVGPSRMLNANVLLICLSLIILTMCGHLHYLVVWVCAVGLGLGISTVFAGLMNLANQYTDGNVSSRSVAVFMGSSAAGSMMGPAVGGWLFRRVHTASLLYYLLAWAALECCVYVGIQVYYARSRKLHVSTVSIVVMN